MCLVSFLCLFIFGRFETIINIDIRKGYLLFGSFSVFLLRMTFVLVSLLFGLIFSRFGYPEFKKRKETQKFRRGYSYHRDLGITYILAFLALSSVE